MTPLIALSVLTPFVLVGLFGYWVGKGHARRASYCAKCGQELRTLDRE